MTERLPKVSPTVVVADFETELVVLVPETRHAHLLEPELALVFDSCRRGDGRVALVAELAEASKVSIDAAVSWVDGVLAEFDRLGITSTRGPGVADLGSLPSESLDRLPSRFVRTSKE